MGNIKKQKCIYNRHLAGNRCGIAETLIKAGCNVFMHYFSSDEEPLKLKSISERYGQKAICVQGDLTKQEDVANCVKAAVDFMGLV
jgi:3-oxoacyl-[acyl-carrier protein] reductase